MRKVTIDRRRFGDERVEDRIAYWQEQGFTAIWEATHALVRDWCVLHGLDPDVQRVDRTRLERRPAPWVVRNGPDSDREP